MTDDRPVLTYSQVREWRRRIAEIPVQIAALQAENTTLGRKLEAARVLMGDLPDDEVEVAEQTSFAQDLSHEGKQSSEPFPEVVLKAVGSFPGAPKPAEIKSWILEHGTASESKTAKSAYFYTVLMRHARTGRLIKDGEGYRLPSSSPQGEAGGMTPPADSVTSPLQTSAPLQAAAEAGGT